MSRIPALAITLLAGVTALAWSLRASPLHAEEGFSKKSLSGRYALTVTGYQGTTPFFEVGWLEADGDGGLVGAATQTSNGIRRSIALSGSYHVADARVGTFAAEFLDKDTSDKKTLEIVPADVDAGVARRAFFVRFGSRVGITERGELIRQ